MNRTWRNDPAPRLSREELARQSRIVRAAQSTFISTEAVCAFLNSRHEGLRGRPLAVATASDAGLYAVEAALQSMVGGR
jgi:uncharacterized protein (DUF2384 family)